MPLTKIIKNNNGEYAWKVLNNENVLSNKRIAEYTSS